MKRYVIDFRKVKSIEEAHKEIKTSLGFPDYYGENLDALNDCISELNDDLFIYILVKKKSFDGIKDIMNVLRDNDIKFEVITTIGT